MIDEFENDIRRNGVDPNDFEIVVKDDPINKLKGDPSSHDVVQFTSKILIVRKSTGFKKAYRGGHGSTWHAEFVDDLNNGIFGRAP